MLSDIQTTTLSQSNHPQALDALAASTVSTASKTSKLTTPYQFNVREAYSSRLPDGSRRSIPYLVGGLLTLGQLAIVGGKPKSGKSSFSRALAVAGAKGEDFLGRPMIPCESLIFSYEDPDYHTDNALEALSYEAGHDAAIRVVFERASTTADALAGLRRLLQKLPQTKLVVIDTLAKFLHISDMSDYSPVMHSVLQIDEIAREYNICIVALAHCKKSTASDDLFDRILGSSALRGGVATNIILYTEKGQRFIASETRIGKSIPATLLESELTEIDEGVYLKSISLGADRDMIEELRAVGKQTSERLKHERDILQSLAKFGGTATQVEVFTNVTCRAQTKIEVVSGLVERGLVQVLPEVKPKTLKLNRESPLLKSYLP